MDIQKYTTHPDEIEAIQLSRENIEDVADWCGGEIITEPKASDPSDVYMALTVPRTNGPIDSQIGYYVIKNARGRFEVMKPELFSAKYGRSRSPLVEAADRIIEKVKEQEIPEVEARRSAREMFFGKPSGR